MRNPTVLLSLLMFPKLALAHAADVLILFYAQLTTVVFIIFVLCAFRKLRRYWLSGTLACLAGVGLSWFIDSHIPFYANQLLVTTISVICPLTTTAIFLACRSTDARRK